MLDHLLFNKKKWYQGEVPNYIGKYADSAGVLVYKVGPNGVPSWISTWIDNGKTPAKYKVDHMLISAQLIYNNEIYIRTSQTISDVGDNSFNWNWIKATDVTITGGGN